ncbi:PepSY-like domain-containing protein, partial [Bacteroidales bacterium OttesenSCG-928-L14]|nr:PepSY-like domain-containing protein [Bacteroidales bacterium OttesenSCG-928-L14]
MKEKFLILIMIFMSMSFLACDPANNTHFPDDYPTNQDPEIYDELVTVDVYDFVQTHFPDFTILYAKKDYDDGKTSKEIYIRNENNKHFEIEFDMEDNWIKVEGDDDCKSVIPESIINILPSKISEYINTNYKNAKVYEVEKKHNSYKLDIEKNLRDFELY